MSSYDVEAARVGQRDYDKLTLDVTTDDSVDPREAIGGAADILIRQLAIFTDIGKIEGFGEAAAAQAATQEAPLAHRDGELPDRGAQARRPLVQLPEAGRDRTDRRPRDEVRGELAAIPNFGKKSIEEVKETLATHGLNLRGDDSQQDCRGAPPSFRKKLGATRRAARRSQAWPDR